ncbi:hypothetical protein HAL07_11930 [Helicobacter ailurogastricus]|uniref:Uncharacterized protein n=1 Tax=Helicobacter ailurogastricus TaxID=1578720 RepID=A0A0K2Y1C2_9HELI|nr:hypothetical protein HAL07_11930 [Helicobacter ailurogastricus]
MTTGIKVAVFVLGLGGYFEECFKASMSIRALLQQSPRTTKDGRIL